jgi:hypothetical protein
VDKPEPCHTRSKGGAAAPLGGLVEGTAHLRESFVEHPELAVQM